MTFRDIVAIEMAAFAIFEPRKKLADILLGHIVMNLAPKEHIGIDAKTLAQFSEPPISLLPYFLPNDSRKCPMPCLNKKPINAEIPSINDITIATPTLCPVDRIAAIS